MIRTIIFLLLMSGMAQADCRLALALAMDVSSSVDQHEDRLQRQGLASALVSPEVIAAFFASDTPVALAVYEWSGRYNQDLLLRWTLIDTKMALETAARVISRSKRGHNDYPTAMGHALGFGAGLFQNAPTCDSKTLDLAGDGENNDGFGPLTAYREFPFHDIIVNGLVINGADFEAETGLVTYYQEKVAHGAGSFVEIAQGFEDFERAMRR